MPSSERHGNLLARTIGLAAKVRSAGKEATVVAGYNLTEGADVLTSSVTGLPWPVGRQSASASGCTVTSCGRGPAPELRTMCVT